MSTNHPPLSHHEVLELAAPFTRGGLRVDLEGSAREQRQLLFRATDPLDTAVWRYEDLGLARVRLTRTLRHADGAEAVLRASGADAGRLLARMQAVPPRRHFSSGPGYVVARDYTLDGDEAQLSRALLHLQGLQLTLTVPAVKRVAGDIALLPVADRPRPALPEDLLAVLGWNWARLGPTRAGWTSKLRLRGSVAQRTRQAEAAAERAAAHLAQTLAEAPAQYHARHRAARWGVFFRRGIPSFTALALVGLVLLSAALEFQPTAMQMVLMYHLPTLVIALSFVLQELPRFEIPPLPRATRAPAWFGTRA